MGYNRRMTIIAWILIVLAVLAFIGAVAIPHALWLLIIGLVLLVAFGGHYYYGRRSRL